MSQRPEPQQRPLRVVAACEYCGRPLEIDERIDVVVPDSSHLHPDDPQQGDQAEATLHDVAARAGLSYPQLLRAIEWCAERPDVQHRDRASTTAWRRAT